LRRRRYPIVGSGRGIHSFVHIDDAARATVAALSGPPGCYNIVDDEPAPAADWVPALAAAVGGPVPRHVPAGLAGVLAGKGLVNWMETLRGADNSAAKLRLGWRPDHPSWRQGFATEGVSSGRSEGV
ncbi:MAG: NAD(P)-dependent oxidoreductase, partial [Actinomycetota bacterium]|nr:NAD(P)-dependent oxidoreductase [Actinomycetota bacterium]